jgi:predicted nucleotidyltransferase
VLDSSVLAISSKEISVSSPISALGAQLGCTWENIEACRVEALRRRQELTVLERERLVPADAAVVVFGSLARQEWTQGSDIDWTLLVDGSADPEHLTVTHSIRTRLEQLGYKEPGRTGVFGGLTISHELVHRIGGEHDTNRNTTQRILLLLESASISPSDIVRERVIRVLFTRYLADDQGYHASEGWKIRVPRFLLNDIVRYWRTMAVDFAAKRRERAGEGWALRNFKLRLSRKLIFAAGLISCISCQLRPSANLINTEFASARDFYSALTEFMIAFSNITPLEILAQAAQQFEAAEAGKLIFDAYDEFLGVLRDDAKRARLETLDLDAAMNDSLFRDAKRIGNTFQEGLTRLFFGTDLQLTAATQRYGVF